MNISDLTKKISSFHTHTYLCNHAQGTVTDYYSVAVSEGCSALGFSDHCPYPNDGVDTWPDIRMTPFKLINMFRMFVLLHKNLLFPFIVDLNVNMTKDIKIGTKI